MRLYSILAAAGIVGLFGFYLVGKAARPDKANIDGYALQSLRMLPVQEGGRIKPLDTYARTALRIIFAKEEFADPVTEKKLPAIRWFIEAAAFEPPTREHPVPNESRTGITWSAETFRIDNDQVAQLLDLKLRSGLSYALRDFYDNFDKLASESEKAKDVDPARRDLYQTKLLEFRSHLDEFLKINQHFVAVLPPLTEGGKWETPAEVKHTLEERARKAVGPALRKKHNLDNRNFRELPEAEQMKILEDFDAASRDEYKRLLSADPRLSAWEDMIRAYRDRSPERFEKAVNALAACSKTIPEKELKKSRFEVFFNHFEPFVDSMAMYIVVVILAGGAMLTCALSPSISGPFRWSALGMMALAVGVHGFGLVSRMYLQDRWLVFVTNLYSSAIFIGWTAGLMSLVMELLFPRGIALTVGGVIGLTTSIIAHNLGSDRDTLEMMQAVLDTNFWLATHVTTVSLGYMATFLAGLLGFVFITLGLFTPLVDRDLWKVMSQMIYGVICAATLLSFTGTVLGGIWADQSWGRFWGWDPKENGAVLIVLWNVIVLHARWAGMVKQRGIAVMALFGNIVTAWSWFGTNELGIGLHSYGFMEGTRLALVLFGAFNVVAMGIGMVPTNMWFSVKAWNRGDGNALPGDVRSGRPRPQLA
jgi:ABC-type transport system involved in cytochrome c biogenesis permease subunit